MNRRQFISGLAIAGGASAQASTLFGVLTPTVAAYYVDSVNGSDSNNGLTPSTAFATIAHLTSVDAGANKSRWRLVTGSSFREQLTVPRAGMTIDAYGSGASPLLDCSDIISAGAWTKTGGQTNVYQATLTVPVNTPSDPDWYTSVWQAGTRYTIAHSIASVDSTASSYYPVPVNSTTITLYVHTSTGASPAGFTMEYAARLAGIMGQNINGLTINGITARRNIDANGSMIVGKDCIFNNCQTNEGNKHNIFFDAGAVLNNHQCNGAYYENIGSTMYIGFGTADATRGFVFNTCTAANMGLQDNTPPGFYIHSASLGTTFPFVNFTNCTGSIGFSSCLVVTIAGCTSTTGITAFDATSLVISNTGITFNGSDQFGVSCPVLACAVTLNTVTITGPSLSGSPGTTCVSLANGGSLAITGCTLQTATNAVNFIGSGPVSMTTTTVNVFHFGWVNGASLPAYSVDHNNYTSYSANEFWNNNGTAMTSTQWKATGQDAHSTF